MYSVLCSLNIRFIQNIITTVKTTKKVFHISKLTKVVNFVSILNTPIDFNKVLASGFSETYNLV